MNPIFTSPHMGNTYIGVKAFLETMGCRYLPPPPTSRKTIELGVKHSPECACFPYKVTLGNMIEGLERGANIVLMASGKKGLCRLAYYHIVQKKALEDLGFDFEMVGLGENIWDVLFNKMKVWSGNPHHHFWRLIKATRITFKKLKLIEKVEALARETRPYEIKKGETSKVYHRCLKLIDQAKNLSQLRKVKKLIESLFSSIPKDSQRDVLRVVLVGEFFCCLEPAVSHQIETILGELGVLVKQNMSSYRLAKGFLFPDLRKWWLNHFVVRKYLKCTGGGEERRSLGETEIYAKRGYDGVIALKPFTCLPENTAEAIFPHLSKKFKIPVLSLSLDENFSEINMLTRIESFVDMLRRKRSVSGN
ncbi:CoA protein activase [Candidatus Aerophobetes bacterium]|uniref:CoA protein activase n=1 Tax=Aerophobetes bacterium TaxID=2030807 RepID=A0A662DF69_UNCAE|nr:MAG: CoA protein activase [Candidatus Aerophobetes bacterium]